jgi:hypothetical protein
VRQCFSRDALCTLTWEQVVVTVLACAAIIALRTAPKFIPMVVVSMTILYAKVGYLSIHSSPPPPHLGILFISASVQYFLIFSAPSCFTSSSK